MLEVATHNVLSLNQDTEMKKSQRQYKYQYTTKNFDCFIHYMQELDNFISFDLNFMIIFYYFKFKLKYDISIF